MKKTMGRQVFQKKGREATNSNGVHASMTVSVGVVFNNTAKDMFKFLRGKN